MFEQRALVIVFQTCHRPRPTCSCDTSSSVKRLSMVRESDISKKLTIILAKFGAQKVSVVCRAHTHKPAVHTVRRTASSPTYRDYQ